MSSSCDPQAVYFLLAVSPQALLAYVAEGLLTPLLLFLYARNKAGRRRIFALMDFLRTWSGD